VDIQVSEQIGSSEDGKRLLETRNPTAPEGQQGGAPAGALPRQLPPESGASVSLVSTNDFDPRRELSAVQTNEADPGGMQISSVAAGEYRVRVETPVGYVASVRSGGTDLQTSTLVVSGGA